MSIKDLIIGDRIRIQEVNGVEITVQIKNVYRLVQSSFDIDKWVADVEAIDGRELGLLMIVMIFTHYLMEMKKLKRR